MMKFDPVSFAVYYQWRRSMAIKQDCEADIKELEQRLNDCYRAQAEYHRVISDDLAAWWNAEHGTDIGSIKPEDMKIKQQRYAHVIVDNAELPTYKRAIENTEGVELLQESPEDEGRTRLLILDQGMGHRCCAYSFGLCYRDQTKEVLLKIGYTEGEPVITSWGYATIMRENENGGIYRNRFIP